MRGKGAIPARRMAYIAVMTVVLCICAWITVPFTVPFTMQTFGVFAALLLLGGRDGTAAIGLYLFLGIVGLPVFSGFSGGVDRLFGPTGGYLIGFLFTGLAHMLAEPLIGKQKYPARIALLGAEYTLCYLVGTLWFMVVYGYRGEPIGFFAALGLCVLPYVLPDLVKIILAELIARRIKKYVVK